MRNARSITAALDGNWHGGYGLAKCPAHVDRKPSLSLADGSDGRLLAKCFAGCAFTDILLALRARDIVSKSASFLAHDPAAEAARRAEVKEQAEKRAQQARRLWTEALPVHGTLAESYLHGRGINGPLPDTLRFHPDCWHKSAKRLPALVGLVEAAATFAVHRTYLDHVSLGKSMADPSKAMLGAVSGGAVRLSERAGALVVAEGIETALSLAGGLLPSAGPVWAALSAGGMKSLRLPVTSGELIVCPDGDAAGRAAARALAERAVGLGWRVSLADPGDGLDFNDLVRREVAA